MSRVTEHEQTALINRLDAYAKAQGWSGRQLAIELNVSRNSLKHWRTNERLMSRASAFFINRFLEVRQ